MEKLGRATQNILKLQSSEQMPILQRSMSSITWQNTKLGIRHFKSWNSKIEKNKRFIPTTSEHILQCIHDFNSQTYDSDTHNKKFKEVVKKHNLKVPSFGGSVSACSPVDITVRSADPTHYHNLDHAVISLMSCNKSNCHPAKLDVSQEEHKVTVHCTLAKEANFNEYQVDVEVPIVHNVKVSALENACVDVHDFIESNYVNVRAESGQVTMQQIKTENLTIHTKSGDVFCQGTLQGDIKITSNDGNVISGKRFMGPNVELETENGDIRVASSYSEEAKFSTNRGSMNLRNIHNESYVAVYDEGDVKVQGLDGSTNIFVKKGDLDVHISRIRNESRIHVEDGDIHLKLSDSYPIKVSIDANEIIPDSKCHENGKGEKRLDSEYQHFFIAVEPNKFSPTLIVVAENGSVEVEMQNWASSVGINLRA